MSSKASVTINRPPAKVEALWRDPEYRPDGMDDIDASVRFVQAPGERGTEIHAELHQTAPGGKLGEAVQKVAGTEPLAKLKDHLRRFKQLVETGEIARSEAVPEGEVLERKLKRRPAQPLDGSELEKASV